MAALQKRVGENLVASILLQRLIHLFVKQTAKEVFGDTQVNNEETKKQLESKIKMLALMSIVDKYCLIGASFEQQKQAVKGKQIERGDESDSDSDSSGSDEEAEEEQSENDAASRGSKGVPLSAGPTRFEEKVVDLLGRPFTSLPKLFSLFPVSTVNAVNSLKTLKSMDYLTHFVVT